MHSSHSETSELVDYPRKRALVACEVCRLRKTKCDAVRPQCSFCAGLDLECVYRTTRRQASKRAKPNNRRIPSLNQDLHALSKQTHTLIGESGVSNDPQLELEWQGRRNNTVEDGLGRAGQSSPSDRVLSMREPQQLPGPEAQIVHASPVTVGATSSVYSFSEADEAPCLIGLSLRGLSRLTGYPTPWQLQPLIWDDSEKYYEIEERQYNQLFGPTHDDDLSCLDSSFRTCWRYQQAFVRNILSWFPLLDQQTCALIVQTTSEKGFSQTDPNSPLSLLMLALGAFTRTDHRPADTINTQPPGIEYFRAACRLLTNHPRNKSTIVGAQSYILKS
ncbi:hypothetical protein A1O1_08256 [Capronia coronata CBS 617.96]|uniref:Zn(2)-C6 fungal-type domain-containing protein n=1 Tax=Capronia coronata CBS 617.96 TaxID=1182541 RepID=W9YCQ3_9EURO|nr:uncharacterized protein A1O1_08256 [Capronia coronata CBS 617.96]EXJ80114.1 hypothetical protein A1O1_08256 [Capronia coronata CBS 617.96]